MCIAFRLTYIAWKWCSSRLKDYKKDKSIYPSWQVVRCRWDAIIILTFSEGRRRTFTTFIVLRYYWTVTGQLESTTPHPHLSLCHQMERRILTLVRTQINLSLVKDTDPMAIMWEVRLGRVCCFLCPHGYAPRVEISTTIWQRQWNYGPQ
jgi:hypothetical protein